MMVNLYAPNIELLDSDGIAIIRLITGMFTIIISSFSEWLVMAIGCWLIINNKFTIGAYIAFIGYLGRLYKVAENKIFIDNNDINKISRKCLREQIAYIQQDTIIFDDTVRNNITLNIQTNESVFEKVCEKVRLDKIVNDLPMKYDTMIDKLSLSGGEKHKIAIARAILKNAKIILCDEITSDLDGIAEKEIINIFKNISNNCTVIFIAHRITSILGMQNICIIKDGKIVDCGNSDDLLLRNNYFRDLLNMQPQ